MLVSANEGGLEDSNVTDHGVKSIAFNAAGTYLAGSWRRRAFSCCANQVLVTECVTSQPEACYPWLQKLIDVGSWTASENLLTQWQDFFPVFLSTNLLARGHSCVSSHIVSSENPRCVSDRPRQHRRMCCHYKRRDFVFENCQICSGKSTHR